MNEGITCKCGKFTVFSSWVHAHWYMQITFTCPKCRRQYLVYEGESSLIEDLPTETIRKPSEGGKID